MTSEMHRELDDLLAEVPRHVRLDAKAAWVTGARRRTRARAGAAAAAVAVVVLAIAGVSLLPSDTEVDPANTRGAGVREYPTRLEYAYWSRSLPDRPGPLAGVMERGNGDGTESLGWYAVTPTGHLYEIPNIPGSGWYPTLSGNGTMLGWVDDKEGTYRTQNLVTGDTVPFPTFVTSQKARNQPSEAASDLDVGAVRELSAQIPSYWSPDSTRVAVFDGHLNLLGPGDDVTRFRAPNVPKGVAQPVGWVDATHLGWLASTSPGTIPEGAPPSATYIVTDDTGQVTRRTPLPLDATLTSVLARRGTNFNQWTGSLSPTGDVLALQTQDRSGDTDTTITTYDTTTGQSTGRTVTPDVTTACGFSWAGSNPVVPVVPVTRTDDAIAVRLPEASRSPLVQADPRLGIGCTAWAPNALNGNPHRGLSGRLFNHATPPIGWYWRETSLAVLVLVGGAILVGARRRRSLAVSKERLDTP
jgi:hypothetical protein